MNPRLSGVECYLWPKIGRFPFVGMILLSGVIRTGYPQQDPHSGEFHV